MSVWEVVEWTSESDTASHVAGAMVPPSSVLRPRFRSCSLGNWQNLSCHLLGRINDWKWS